MHNLLIEKCPQFPESYLAMGARRAIPDRHRVALTGHIGKLYRLPGILALRVLGVRHFAYVLEYGLPFRREVQDGLRRAPAAGLCIDVGEHIGPYDQESDDSEHEAAPEEEGHPIPNIRFPHMRSPAELLQA